MEKSKHFNGIINNGDYLWNLSIQGNEGLISYDEDFNVLSNIISGVS